MRFAILCLLTPIALAGCSGTGTSEPARTAVTGSVSFQGKPLSGAMVQFVPSGPGGELASGRTDASGHYALMGTKGGAGAVPGAYKVVISRVLGSDGKELPPDTSPYSPGVKESLPRMYSNPEDTTLTATVTDAPTATIDFPLSGKGGAMAGMR